MLHKIAMLYATWLVTPVGQSEKPPILYIFVFCPLAAAAAIAYGLPYYAALWHGVPLDSSLQGIDKHGRAFLQPIRPWITADLWILLVPMPLFFSALAFQLGWVGREVRDGTG
jgi:hypothetical protein